MKSFESPKVLDMFIKKYQLQDILRDIKHKVYIQHFQKGESIICEDDELQYFHLFVDGKATVAPLAEDGKLAIITFMEPLSLIGDIEYFEKIPYLHSMQAISDCYLIAIPIPIVEHYLMNNPFFLRKLCELTIRKLRMSSEQSAQNLLYPVKKRLVIYLLEHITGHDLETSIPVKYIDLANIFGITTRHLRRIITELEDQEMIRREGNLIMILDIQQLRRYAEYL